MSGLPQVFPGVYTSSPEGEGDAGDEAVRAPQPVFLQSPDGGDTPGYRRGQLQRVQEEDFREPAGRKIIIKKQYTGKKLLMKTRILCMITIVSKSE